MSVNSSVLLTNNSSNTSSSDDDDDEYTLSSDEVSLTLHEEARSSIIKNVDGRLLAIRVLNIIMSMISFSVMSSVHFSHNYNYDCEGFDNERWTRGSFNYRAYQAALSAGVIVWLANIIILTLPVLLYLAGQSKTFQSMMKPLHTACKITTTSTAISTTSARIHIFS